MAATNARDSQSPEAVAAPPPEPSAYPKGHTCYATPPQGGKKSFRGGDGSQSLPSPPQAPTLGKACPARPFDLFRRYCSLHKYLCWSCHNARQKQQFLFSHLCSTL